MKCEEFEAIGLGLKRRNGCENGTETAARAAAVEHANTCPRCAALQESWEEARVGLRALREDTQIEAPARVEMRLRQEFRTKHKTLKLRTRAMLAGWTLAAAGLLVGFVSWWSWHVNQQRIVADRNVSGRTSSEVNGNSTTGSSLDAVNEPTLLADNEGDFTLLPGSLPEETQDGAILRVRMQRGTLADLGVPVNEDGASDWVQVDLLVGEDGQPRAVRLPSEPSN